MNDQAQKLRDLMKMNDQAQKLRDLMSKKINKQTISSELLHKERAKIISISSGKGGVGKTNITLNLAIAMKKNGKSVCVIDADIGLSNMEIISGQSMPLDLLDIIHKNMSLEEIVVKGPAGISMISGGSGLSELNLLKESKNAAKLIFEIQKLQDSYDYILIDTGAGISESVTKFILISDTVIVISTPEPTSIMDAYVLIKTIVNLGFKGKTYHLTNMAKNANDGKIAHEKIKFATNSFLKLEIDNLGYIEASDVVLKAVRTQVPFLIINENSLASKSIKNIAAILEGNKKSTDNIGLVERFMMIFKKE